MAVNSSSWKSMPIAPRDTTFNADKAKLRIKQWAGPDVRKYNQAFLWRNASTPPNSPDSYRLPVADVVNGKLVMIPHAVFTAASILSGAHGGLEGVVGDDEKIKLKTVVTEIYAVLQKAYGDPRTIPPWMRGGNTEEQVLNASTHMEEMMSMNPEDVLTASVNSSGWASMPIADLSREWDSDSAKRRVFTLADGDMRRYRKAFLWYDAAAPELKGSYKLPIADVIDGTLTIVPRAVNAVAQVLGGARGGVDIPDADMDKVQAVVDRIQKRFQGPDNVRADAGYDEEDTQPCGEGQHRMPDGTCMDDEDMTELSASAVPVAPPDDWFQAMPVTGPTPLTVTADGRVFGHAFLWNTCHQGFADRCVMAPKSITDYKFFKNGQVLTASGKMLKVGKITLGTGHASMRAGWIPAADHYDNTGTQAAVVNIVEDRFGGFIAGAAVPGISEEKIAELRRSPISGDWRRINGNLELVAALAVNTPGFPIVSVTASGEPDVIIAAGQFGPEHDALVAGDDCGCEPQTPEDRRVLARLADIDITIKSLSDRQRRARMARLLAGNGG